MNCGFSRDDRHHEDDYTLATYDSYDTYGGDTYSSRTRNTYRTYRTYDNRNENSLGTIGEMFGCSRPNTRNSFYNDDHTLMTIESVDCRDEISYISNKLDAEERLHQNYERDRDFSHADLNYMEVSKRAHKSAQPRDDETPIPEDSASTNSATGKCDRRQTRSHIDSDIENVHRLQKPSHRHISKSNLPKTSLADEISVLTKEIEDPPLMSARNGPSQSTFKNMTLRSPSPTDLSSLTMSHYSPTFKNPNSTFKNTNYNHSSFHQHGDYQGDRDNALVEHRDERDPYIENIEARRRSVSNHSPLSQKPPSSPNVESMKHNSHCSNSSSGKMHMLPSDVLHSLSTNSAGSCVRVVDAYGAVDKTELEQYNVPPGQMGLKLRSSKEGVMITRKAYNSVCPQLSVGDIIIALDGIDISTFFAKAVKKLLDARDTQPNRSIIYKPGFLSKKSEVSDPQLWAGSNTNIGQPNNHNSPSHSTRSNESNFHPLTASPYGMPKTPQNHSNQVPFNCYTTNPGTAKEGYSLNTNKPFIANGNHSISQSERSNDLNFHESTFSPYSTIHYPQNSSNLNSINNVHYSQRGDSLSSKNLRRSLTSHLQLHHANFENHNNT